MIITAQEAKSIYKKKRSAISRAYPSCPYESKQKFTMSIERGGRLVPFAYCVVRSVRPITSEDYEGNPELALAEGYSSIDAWRLAQGRVTSQTQRFRISFNVEKLHEQLLKEQANVQAGRGSAQRVPAQENSQYKIN